MKIRLFALYSIIGLILSSCFSQTQQAPTTDTEESIVDQKIVSENRNPEQKAIDDAAQIIAQAWKEPTAYPVETWEKALPHICRSHPNNALALFPELLAKRGSADNLRHYADCLNLADRGEDARLVMIQAMRSFKQQPELFDQYLSVVEAYPRFAASPRLFRSGVDADTAKNLGGGSTLVFKIKKKDENTGAFKPQQKRLQSDYRSEIAAYRLASLIAVSFSVPLNEHIFIEYNQFLNMYRRVRSNPDTKTQLADLTTVRGQDNKDYVHGTLKEWISEFTEFPIEIRSMWLPWLDGKENFDTPSALAIDRVAKFVKNQHPLAASLVPKLEKMLDGVTQYELARQLSQIIVFDYLINNWDRFSGVKKFWGINCQIKKKRFVSIDNGAAFPRTPNPKPDNQLKSIRRFSKITHQAILALDRDKTLHTLFPDASDYEKERFETFWRQRQRYIEYVDKLIAEFGEDNILFFD